LINSSIYEFLHNIHNISAPDEASDGTSNIMVPLPFKDQNSANSVEKRNAKSERKNWSPNKPCLSVEEDQPSSLPERDETPPL